jgi:hypothetical protein
MQYARKRKEKECRFLKPPVFALLAPSRVVTMCCISHSNRHGTWLVQNARLRGLMRAAAWKHAGTGRKKVVENQQFGELACSSS